MDMSAFDPTADEPFPHADHWGLDFLDCIDSGCLDPTPTVAEVLANVQRKPRWTGLKKRRKR